MNSRCLLVALAVALIGMFIPSFAAGADMWPENIRDIRLPLVDTAEGLLGVSLTVNGKGPYLFVVDTGASSTIVEPRTARDAGLDSFQDRGPGQGTAIINVPFANIDLGLGSLTLTAQRVGVSSIFLQQGGSVGNILGIDAFHHLIGTWSHSSKELILRQSLDRSPDGHTSLTLEYSQGMASIMMDLVDITLSMGLDTGSVDVAAIMQPDLARRIAALNRDAIKQSAPTATAGGQFQEEEMEIEKVALGPWTYTKLPVSMSGLQGVPTGGVLGVGLLRNFDWTMNLRGKQLWLKPLRPQAEWPYLLVWNGYAESRKPEKNFQKALDLFNRALASDPKNLLGRMGKIRALLKLQRPKDALMEAEALRRDLPQLPDVQALHQRALQANKVN